MTRGYMTAFSARAIAALTMALVLLVADGGNVTAAKPKPPPPPPPTGTIYFHYYSGTQRSIWGIKADGSGLAQALPEPALQSLNPGWTGHAQPAFQPTGGHRWWITTAQTGTYDEYISSTGTMYFDEPHWDLVAVRRRPTDSSQLDVVQLTDLYGVFRVLPQTGQWSNDSNENLLTSFAAGYGYDLRGAFFEDESGTSVDMGLAEAGVLRVPVTASEIASGTFVPVDGTLSDPEIDDLVWPYIYLPNYNHQGADSPAGDLFLALKNNQRLLQIVTADAGPLQVLWDGTSVAPRTMISPQWSPDGLTVAVAADNGDVWTLPVSGSAPPKKILSVTVSGSTTMRYRYPVWSPDSKHVAAIRDDATTSPSAARIVRVPAAGGTPVVLGLALPTTSGGRGIRWVSSN